MAGVQRLSAPRGRIRRDARSRWSSTPTNVTTSTRWRRRSRSRRASCSCATRTTRPRRRSTSTRSTAFLDRIPRARVRDPRRGVLRVRAVARRYVRLGRAAAPLSRTSCCCGRSPRSTASPGCASATPCAPPRTSGSPSTRSASRSTSAPPPRPPPLRRFAGRTRSSAASCRRSPPAARSSTTSAALGLWVAESDANFIWLRLPEEIAEADVSPGCATVACSSGPGSLTRARERAPGHGRHRPRERAVRRRPQRARPLTRPPSAARGPRAAGLLRPSAVRPPHSALRPPPPERTIVRISLSRRPLGDRGIPGPPDGPDLAGSPGESRAGDSRTIRTGQIRGGLRCVVRWSSSSAHGTRSHWEDCPVRVVQMCR